MLATLFPLSPPLSLTHTHIARNIMAKDKEASQREKGRNQQTQKKENQKSKGQIQKQPTNSSVFIQTEFINQPTNPKVLRIRQNCKSIVHTIYHISQSINSPPDQRNPTIPDKMSTVLARMTPSDHWREIDLLASRHFRERERGRERKSVCV